MTKPNRQELVERIERDLADLQRELDEIARQEAALANRRRLAEGLRDRYQMLLSPQRPVRQPTVTANAGSRTQARQERKQAMIAFLKDRGEAQTAEIIEAMKESLPHANPTRAQVQDVLQAEPEFASRKKGVWGLADPEPSTQPAQPVITHAGGAARRILTPEEDKGLKELLG